MSRIMGLSKVIVLALALMFATVRVEASEAIPQPIVEWAETNVVKVYAGEATGTAWFIEPNLLITACHVVTPWDMVYISPEGTDKRYPAKVLACDTSKDIALLELYKGIPDSVPTTIATENPKTGQPTYRAGYPSALPLIISEGHWQRQAPDMFGGSYLDLGHALPGDSGGPVIVLEDGEVKVVSITEAILQLQGQKFENITFVVQPEKLRDFINENT